MLEEFSSERLIIRRVSTQDPDVIEGVIGVLSGNTTDHLPSDWSNITDLSLAKAWLSQRLSESHVFSVSLNGEKSLIGLLMIYGLEGSSENREVRIGYVISEKLWGQGLATELVRALICHFTQIGRVSDVVGGVTTNNHGSIKVLTKNGFRLDEIKNSTEYYRYKF